MVDRTYYHIQNEKVDSPVLSHFRSGTVTMQDKGLIQRLLAARVVDKRIHELKFSDEFCKHLVAYNRVYGFNGGGTIEIWREILIEFDKSLQSISDKDIAVTIVLLDYFLDKITPEKN